MTIQKAAYKLLNERGKPMSSKELARLALERKMVSSSAQDPVFSLATTIEKNIREDVYNNPTLVSVRTAQGRLIGLPEWNSQGTESKETPVAVIEIRVKIPTDLFEKIKLAVQAKLKRDFDETVSLLLSKGLSIVAADIKKGLMTQMDSLDSL